MTTQLTESPAADYFDFRDDLLGPARTRVLSGAELIRAGQLIYGHPAGFSLYGVPSERMADLGLQVLGRTAIECSVDDYSLAVAEALAAHCGTRPDQAGGFVADLFCGSGNMGYHLGRSLGFPVHAAELDPVVYRSTRHNILTLGLDIDLQLTDYRALLPVLAPRSPFDTYVVEPPWGPAFNESGLDLEATSPPVPQILDDIRRSRKGRACLIVIKTNDRIAHDSLTRSFRGAEHLFSTTPPPVLPAGANMDFHVYRLPA